ncbi:MAG: DegT/DnrJ/EryC1/StrS family aminotransferase [Myxococcales bacterium]|nr:DegT/DnrJ/EryC1/StrS family aminotransferase [Myxococcales bacterium]
MRVHIAEAVYGDAEIDAVVRVLREQPLALVAGPQCARFEARACDILGVGHSTLVSSGSSALLLALAALQLPPGSEVVTPALTFGTTVAPLVQLGLVPVFVDVAPGRLVVDPGSVEAAVGPATRAVLVPDLVGDVPDWAALRTLCDSRGLALVDDAADTWAPLWDGRSTASWADVGITSFYASHMLTLAGTGGLVATDDPTLARRIRQLRGWGRRSAADGEPDTLDARETTLDGVPYDTKYAFDLPGYNMLPSEAGAAFGLVQLDRMDDVRTARARHHARLAEVLRSRGLAVPTLPDRATSTWHALAFRTPHRDALAAHLEAHGIQTRPVLAGNLVRHPMVARAPHRVVGTLTEADGWMREGLMIGCHQGLDEAQLDHLERTIREGT